MTLGVWEELVELRKVTKDMFDLICLLADHNIRDFNLIAQRTDEMRDSYPFLEADTTITKRDNVITKSDKGILRK